ncbi:hydrogenase expression/formation protein HypE [Hahella sp. CCB-MM4]|uniref:hydrogenase expression/formation protein HypE n=1 Tax=Hahella sp. (strain CCB-MM4) TaxID=1926491 RepID=UPI000B9BE744|nr:hydrogenase expression/formation protein HypE [Hahella sp. CCB-MM4]OZG72918.1 hydrogenase expression/formation protein HypE [Hahella sp. CCB-MM4]
MKQDLQHGVIEMAHGSGGRAMAELIDQLFLKHFDNQWLRQKQDHAVFQVPAGRLAMSTDSHVVSPLFFPGGDIGALSVHGTINDVAMSGARPLYLSAGFVIEEGFPLADLERVVRSMARASREAGVPVVTGDTKVVEKGNADGLYINTTGIGMVPDGIDMEPRNIQPGDRILINGSIGDHGIAILSQRENLTFDTDLQSDSQPLHTLVSAMLKSVPGIRCMRDPTRGGVAATLNELAQQTGLGMVLEESSLVISPAVQAVSELLGLDPLYIANEGKLLAFCPSGEVDKLLAAMRSHPMGQNASIIGEVQAENAGMVSLNTCFGGQRLVDWRYSDPLPRIC